MNILSIMVACILVYYLYQASRPLKRQKGGNKGVVIGLVVLLLAGGGVGAYLLLKDDSSPSPSPTPSPVGPPVDPSVSPSVSPSPARTSNISGGVVTGDHGESLKWATSAASRPFGYSPPPTYAGARYPISATLSPSNPTTDIPVSGGSGRGMTISMSIDLIDNVGLIEFSVTNMGTGYILGDTVTPEHNSFNEDYSMNNPVFQLMTLSGYDARAAWWAINPLFK